jgi:signal transduction histidine kinase
MRGLRGIRLSIAAAALLLALLAILAVLQYRWIGEVTDAERARLRASAQASADAVALDFDREIGRVMRDFGGPPRGGEDAPADIGARAAASQRRWSADAKWPGLVSGALLIGRGETGETVARVDLASGRTERIEWPVALEPIHRFLERNGERPDGPPGPGPGAAPPPRPLFFHVFGEPPALLVLAGGHGPSPFVPGTRAEDPQQWLLVLLDTPTIVGQMLPQLVQRHFGTGSEYDVAVLGGDEPASVLYSSRAGVTSAKLRVPEAQTPILGAAPGGGPRGPDPGDRAGTARSESPEGRPRETPERGAWRLVAMHRSGSLDAMVDATRRKNLAVSGAILLLLGATVAFLVASAHAARQLAAQQIEFVAGLTHELRTPLAAIGSAGQNLADGVVADPDRVKKYGQLIHREGRRLSGLIEGALAQAGIAAQAPQAPRGPVAIARLLEEAIETCRHLADREESSIEKDIAPGLPPVLGDAATLRTLFENLLANALKYGGRAGRVRVVARSLEGTIQVSVADSGPGIPQEEIGRIFEPFYRGRGAAGRAGGSGLGLSMVRRIVDSHGGSIAVESGAEGTVFRVTLPPVPETA